MDGIYPTRHVQPQPSAAPCEQQARLLAALAHPLRLSILEQLRAGEACVGELRARLGDPPQAYVSKQLKLLRGAGLVRARKSGQRVYYAITDPVLLDVLDGARALALDHGRRTDGNP